MPRSRVTPLGRQLRSVLVSLQDPAHHLHVRRSVSTRGAFRSHAVASAITARPNPGDDEELEDWMNLTRQEGFDSPGLKLLSRKGAHVDYISAALQATKGLATVTKRKPQKPDLSRFNIRDRSQWQRYKANARRHASDTPQHPANPPPTRSLPRIVANRIRWTASKVQSSSREGESTLLRWEEVAYLQSKGFTVIDLDAWVEILTEDDPVTAAQHLQSLAENARLRDAPRVPLFVLMHLLRKQFLSMQATQLLLEHARTIHERKASPSTEDEHPVDVIFLLTVRLLRHVRESLPKEMCGVVKIYLDYLQLHSQTHKNWNEKTITLVTYQLNELMALVSIATAAEPFKDNPYQEAALVQILAFMSEHSPSLHITRTGYRAVVRVQLSQRKTPSERRWAELKALSWPPWKEDRTGMDALIGLDQGISRAGDTLQRMHAAGYSPTIWERVAKVYTGWDTDDTPTIQTRAILDFLPQHVLAESSTWVARISTTRTIQEAWACYLSWEDGNPRPNQQVYLALLQKLVQEETRQREEQSHSDQHHLPKVVPDWPLLPGDQPRVEPLPPSTHLYTYTRTPPPSVNEFYNHLRKQNISLRGYTLAYLVSHADTLRSGMRYLKDSLSQHPEIEALLKPGATTDFSNVPMPIFAATVELFSRFSVAPLVDDGTQQQDVAQQESDLWLMEGFRIPQKHPLVRAHILLERCRPKFRPPWNSFLVALSKSSKYDNPFRSPADHGLPDPPQDEQRLAVIPDEQPTTTAIAGYVLMRRTLALMNDVHVDLDIVGFHALCLTSENCLRTSWLLINSHERLQSSSAPPNTSRALPNLSLSRLESLLQSEVTNHLKTFFSTYVGNFPNDTTSPSPLLATPNPAILHALIRALGWAADHSNLLFLARWMQHNHAALLERQSRDRQGEAMMRRALVALRVFLERAWVETFPSFQDTTASRTNPDARRERNLLQSFSAPANPVVREEVQRIVESVPAWQGWPSDDEVAVYCADAKFDAFR